MKKIIYVIVFVMLVHLGVMINEFLHIFSQPNIVYDHLGVKIVEVLLFFGILIYLFYEVRKENRERASIRKMLDDGNLQLEAAKQQIAASEEELSRQFYEIQIQKENLKVSRERYLLSLDGAEVGIWDLDYNMKDLFLSTKAMEIVGAFSDDNLFHPSSLINRIVKIDKSMVLSKLERHLMGKADIFEAECRVINDAGKYNWISLRGKAMFDEEDQPIRIAGSISNINHQKLTEEKIVKLAYYDSVTGLPNRNFFSTNYSMITNNGDSSSTYAIVILDLDNFKAINDSLGYRFGDRVLQKSVEIIKEVSPSNSVIGRFGGDEFIILVKTIQSKDEIKNYAQSLVNAFQKRYEIDGIGLTFTVSIGVSIAPEDDKDINNLVKFADTAMHEAKSNGKNCFEFYSRSLNKRVISRLELENQLRKAVENKEFVLHYQPKYDLEKEAITGFEALIRWQHTEKGLIMPNVFISLAEELGLIIPIGEWVVDEVCHEINRLEQIGLGHLTISLNLSAKQFKDINLIHRFIKTLEEHNVNPNSVELEITESTAVFDSKYAFKMLDAFRSFGTKIALDDFGTGYSSFNYLKALPLDYIKIDKSFIDDIIVDKKGEDIIRALITLSHAYGYKVVAEGVETKEQLDFLDKEGCDVIQGYYISKPVPSETIQSVLENVKA